MNTSNMEPLMDIEEKVIRNETRIDAHIDECKRSSEKVDGEFDKVWQRLDKMNGKLWAILVLLMVVAIETAVQMIPLSVG